MKNIQKVVIEPGCVSCGACQAVCPEVFELKGTAQVKQNALINKNEETIRQAAELCPVGVIQIHE